MLLGRAELIEQIESLVHHPFRTRTRAVDLVHHHHRLQAERQSLARHEASLWHGAFDRIYQYQHPIYHRQCALYLAAEIPVSRSVHDVDMHSGVFQGSVLRQDRDAPFALEVVAVHDPLLEMLVSGEYTGLAEQFIYQGGLAMVDVGDDCDIANGAGHGEEKAWKKGQKYSTTTVIKAVIRES